MKRYDFQYDRFRSPAPRVSPDGEWVKYEDAEKLKELNLEMVTVLKTAQKHLAFFPDHNGRFGFAGTLSVIEDVLAKAEGVEE